MNYMLYFDGIFCYYKENMEKNFKNINELIELVKEKETFKFKIKVIANSKINLLDFSNDEFIKVKITQRAIEGKANKAIIEFLAQNLSIAKSNIEITHGEKSSLKTIKIF